MQQPTTSVAAPSSGNAPAVLVVDDNESIAELLSMFLERAGYRAFTAFNGEQALAALRRETLAAVLCDASMPIMNGMEMLRKMRQDTATKSIPFILMSGTIMPTHPSECGPTSFLMKPFEMKDAVEAVSAVLLQCSQLSTVSSPII